MSDIRIDREGVWFYRGAEMTREDIVKLFYRHLKKDSSGHYFIQIGKQHFEVEVEDTVYVVQAVRWDGGSSLSEECIHLYLSDGSIEDLDPETLCITKENIPYCKIRSGRFDARFSLSSYYQLTEHIQHDPARNAYFIRLKGQMHRIPII